MPNDQQKGTATHGFSFLMCYEDTKCYMHAYEQTYILFINKIESIKANIWPLKLDGSKFNKTC